MEAPVMHWFFFSFFGEFFFGANLKISKLQRMDESDGTRMEESFSGDAVYVRVKDIVSGQEAYVALGAWDTIGVLKKRLEVICKNR